MLFIYDTASGEVEESINLEQLQIDEVLKFVGEGDAPFDFASRVVRLSSVEVGQGVCFFEVMR